ncbi:hypothetical protein [Streptomyces alboniger]|uniref:hypothetical protein n=1 Tax=Streptomyces alboniger TaxID=132473 RepID=UPI00142F047A|nr:hypothetical protein [Streptomyces alboniger]
MPCPDPPGSHIPKSTSTPPSPPHVVPCLAGTSHQDVTSVDLYGIQIIRTWTGLSTRKPTVLGALDTSGLTPVGQNAREEIAAHMDESEDRAGRYRALAERLDRLANA